MWIKASIIVESITIINEVVECIIIEICNEKKKHVSVRGLNRAPGSNIEIYKDIMEGTFSKTHYNITFICGDFNTELLNPNHINNPNY